MSYRPAENVPAEVDHTVLFQQVVIELVFGHQFRVMRSLVVYLNRYFLRAVFEEEICVAVVLIDITEVVLRVEIT